MAGTLTLTPTLNFSVGALLRGKEFEREIGRHVRSAVESAPRSSQRTP